MLLTSVAFAACARANSKNKAAMKKMKFPAELDLPVDRDKVGKHIKN
jgi:hypothetical protein